MPDRQSLVVHLLFLLPLVVAIAVGTAAGPARAAPEGESSRPRILIVAPSRERVVIGETRFAVEATAAPGRRIVKVILSVDGRELATLTEPPFEATFDAGTSLASHTLRAEAVDDAGRIGIAFSSTLYVSFVEEVGVQASPIPKQAVLVNVLGKKREPLRDVVPAELSLELERRDEVLIEARLDSRPLAAAILLDVSGSTLPYWNLMAKAAESFVTRLDAADGSEVSIFAGSTSRLAPFSRNHVATRRAILEAVGLNPLLNMDVEAFFNFDFAGSRLYDAMAEAVEAINVQPGQRSIAVFTDTYDTGSRISYEQVAEVIRRANIRLDLIRFGRKQVGAWEMSTRHIKKMKTLAHETGGMEWQIKAPEKIQTAFELLARQLKNRYRLLLAPDPAATPRFRPLRVRASRKQTSVLAPAGIFDDGAAARQ